MAKTKLELSGDSDDEDKPLWDFSDDDAFVRSSSSSSDVGESSKKVAGTNSSSKATRKFCEIGRSSSSSSAVGESSKKVAGTSSSCRGKRNLCKMDSDGSDSSECSEDLDCSAFCIQRAKKFAARAWSNIVVKKETIDDALDSVQMIECKDGPSDLPEGGIGLFACKLARIGDVMAVLSKPSSQYVIANEEDAPAECVQVHTGPHQSTYQTWQRKRGKSRYNGGCANAPKDGKNRDANCIIVKVSKLENTKREYATVLVAIRTIKKNEEIYARYDNSHNNTEFFEAEKQASSSTKQVEVDTKAYVGFAGASKAVGVKPYSTRKKQVIKLEQPDEKQVIKLEQPDKDDDIDVAVAGWSDAFDQYREVYLIKMQEHRDGSVFTTLYRCKLQNSVIKRFHNGRAHEKQVVTIPPSTKPIEVRFSVDMHELIQICQDEQIFFWPGASPEWFLAKKLTGDWKIVQEVEQSIVEVEKCWLNNLISLFGVGRPWEHRFGYFFNLFLHECAQIGKHKRKKKRSDFDCLEFIPLCVQRSKIVEDQFHPSGFMPQSILMFLGQDEVTLKMLDHAFEKCMCYGVTQKPGGCCWFTQW